MLHGRRRSVFSRYLDILGDGVWVATWRASRLDGPGQLAAAGYYYTVRARSLMGRIEMRDQADRLLAIVKDVPSNPNADTLPREVWQRVRSILAEQRMTHREFPTAIGPVDGRLATATSAASTATSAQTAQSMVLRCRFW